MLADYKWSYTGVREVVMWRSIIIIIYLAQVTYNQVATAIVNQSLGKSVSTSLNHNNTTT